MRKQEIRRLSDMELCWLLLGIILSTHSAGGVSKDRTVNNRLIYRARRLMGVPYIPLDDYSMGGGMKLLERETKKRIRRNKKHRLPTQMVLPFPRLEFQLNCVIAHVLLDHLSRWYHQKKVEYNHELVTFLDFEMPLFELAFGLFPMYYAMSNLYTTTISEAILAADDRMRINQDDFSQEVPKCYWQCDGSHSYHQLWLPVDAR